MSFHEQRCEFGGKEIIIQTGKLAKQAGGSVTVQCGDSIVLVTATAASEPKEGIDFLPLTVEYLEKTFAAGKIPGGFFKREGRPTENAILTSRFIDRPLRPLFPENYHFETQVITTVLSASPEDNPDMLAMVGSSAALCISDIPFTKPVAGCRVGRIDGKLCLNPGLAEIAQSDLEIVVAATEDAVVMVEGAANQLPESVLLEAIQFAHKALQVLIQAQKELMTKAAKSKRTIPAPVKDAVISKAVEATLDDVKAALALRVKQDRYAQLKTIKDNLKKSLFSEAEPTVQQKLQLGAEFEDLKSRLMRASILREKSRIDGRGLTDIRPISCEVGLLPRAHGSALFTRGETQAIVTATLGSADDEQTIDGLLESTSKKFMLNYNFPPFSVGEVKPLRSPGRREIGHGHLAERALHKVSPSTEKFPYTIRIVSEILESNGSSSMASVCGGSLAMMDAGIPVESPVAGIAMGLIKEANDVAILSDILGDEDHLGDMDFKVTGTEKGITALQMDIKIEGVTSAIMQTALEQAKAGRLHILKCMQDAISTPRGQLADHAPKIEFFKIPVDKIGEVIGPGGKNIKAILEEFGVKIDIEDDGSVRVFGTDGEAIAAAAARIQSQTKSIEIGTLYEGTVRRIVDFGAFVEIAPKQDGLVHISQIANRRINKVTDVLKEGDRVRVKVIAIEQGKIRLTMREVEQAPDIAAAVG